MNMIENAPLLLAGLLSVATAAVHVFVGGPESTRPLLADARLAAAPRYTLYYCWHLTTLTLIAMSAGFLSPALGFGPPSGAAIWTALAAAFALWSGGLIHWKRQSALALPQWAFFAPIAALGLWGMI